MIHISDGRDAREIRQLAMVAHELRNPLAAASCALRVIERSAHEVPAIELAVPMIQRQLGYISRIVDDLVDVASVASGKLTVRKERVDVVELLRTAIQSCRQRIDAGSLELLVSLRDTSLCVHADPLRLTQVFTNLLDNAVKYSAPCGRIHISVDRVDDSVVIAVDDNGIGIRPDVLPRIFDFFVRGGTPMAGAAGLGVGLAVAKQIVDAHGGSIDVRSAGLGFGACFTVRPPLVSI